LKQVTATIIENSQILKGITHRSGRTISSVHLIWLDCPEIAQEAKPGQFVMVRCGEGCVLPRPFSIHQINKNSIALFFNVWEDGKGTRWLAQCRAGNNIDLLGPLGNGYSIQPGSHNLLLLAGGIGIASLRFLVDEAVKRGLSVTLLCGTPTEHRYPPELLPPEIELVTVTEDGSVGKKGMVTDLLPDFAGWADQVFACGPTGMHYDMALRKKELKLEGKPVQISLEVRMGCGLGVCYGCTVKTKNGLKQVCQDGPVFELDDIIWDEFAQV
jgi:dihydroorotate dehydrogenase electron transfer subunit